MCICDKIFNNNICKAQYLILTQNEASVLFMGKDFMENEWRLYADSAAGGCFTSIKYCPLCGDKLC